jgi:anti-sigma factor RsiW
MMVRDVADLMCKEVVEHITDYLGDGMAPEDRVRLEQHLLICPPCTAYLAQVRATVALARGMGEAPAEAGPSLMALFRRWSQR